LRSVISMVMAPASTGRASRIIQAVTKIDQPNSGTLWMVIPGARMLRKVVIMLIAPRIDEAPDRWTANSARSIEKPDSLTESGGYSTQPTPEPPATEPSPQVPPPGANSEATASEVPAT